MAKTGPALQLDEGISSTLRELLPAIAEATLAGVTAEVPSYEDTLNGQMSRNIDGAIQVALGGFLKLASRAQDADPSTPLEPALEAAYALGRGEARSGRSMDALQAAYRVGARVSWREMSHAAAAAGIDAQTMAKFAELVFAYIDELSAASVAGHADELSTTGRVRERYLEVLCQRLLAGADPDVLTASADRADWPIPRTLTAVLLPAAHERGGLSYLNPQTLRPREDVPGLAEADEMVTLLVPDAEASGRPHLLRQLRDKGAIIGPARPWMGVRSSYLRALRAFELGLDGKAGDAVDTDLHLADLVIAADRESLEDLRRHVLAPLDQLRPATAQRLAETLRSWLLHQGHRNDVAADLFVHAQTVRYRMDQLRDLYGDRLNDPQWVLDLTLALHDLRADRA